MSKFRISRPFGLRRNNNASRGRRLAVWTATFGAVALLAGVLQSASATSLSQEIVQGTTTTKITSSSSDTGATPDEEYSSVVGESVTYTATVTEATPPFPDGGQEPTGLVDFVDVAETPPICADVPLDDPSDPDDPVNDAECAVTPDYSDPATHTIRATYEGNDDFMGSEDDLMQVVEKADTTVGVASSTDPSVSGQAVVYTATVSVVAPGEATPSGNVDFFEDDLNGDPQAIPECSDRVLSFNSVTSAYEATCSPTTATYLSAGTHDISATYEGNDDLNESTGPEPPFEQNVEKAQTEVGVSSPGPAKTNQTVTYTAVVTIVLPGTDSPVPTGTVTFKEGGTVICNGPVTLSTSGPTAGTAQCSRTYSTAGNRSITAEYSGDDNFLPDTSAVWDQAVSLPYLVTSSLSGSSTDPSNASFRVSGGPARSYTLCVRLDGGWRSGPREDLRTPEPNGGDPGESWATKWTLNTNDRCKGFTWNSGSASTQSLHPDFGFAAKGTYVVTLKIEGQEIDTARFTWNSWCPPSGLRNVGVWRPSRLKSYDTCKVSSGYVGKGGSRSSLDQDLGWRWMSGLGRLHVEYVAMDSGWYSNPTTGKAPLLRAPGGAGTDNRWTLWGDFKCDTYHGWKEFHRVYMAQQGNAIFITGAQYSTKTPSVSGTWSPHTC